MYNLLTITQTKMLKAREFGYLSAALNLKPAMKVKKHNLDIEIKNTCPDHGRCAKTCIAYTGRNRFDTSQNAQNRRTLELFDDPKMFFAKLDIDLATLAKQARNLDALPTCRLNCLSDLPWESIRISGSNVFERHRNIMFLDYTKTFRRLSHKIPNYKLVYSYNEQSDDIATRNYMLHGAGLVSIVFDTGSDLPSSYTIAGHQFNVIDGDIHDLLHLHNGGQILGLRYKRAFSSKTGKALPADSDFVVSL